MLPAYKAEPKPDKLKSAQEIDRCIERTAACDREAFALLYQSTSGAVYAYALSVLKNRQDAEDVLHDSYVNIYQTAQAYRSEGKPMAWIMTITRNLCLHKLRERSRRAEQPDCDWDTLLRTDSGLGDEERLLLRACMDALGGEERKIFLLHAVSGFKHREIAEFMALPLATVLSKYSRAVKKMRNFLEEAGLYD